MQRTEKGWKLHFDDGNSTEFSSYKDATQARWNSYEARVLNLNGAVREAIENSERNLTNNQARRFEFDADTMSVSRMKRENPQLTATLDERMEISSFMDDGRAEQQQYAEAVAGNAALSQDRETMEASTLVLGTSSVSFREDVRVGVSKLYRGFNAASVVEETLETDASHLLKNGKREWMIKALRETEQQTGEQLLPKGVADTDLTVLQLKEAYSHVGVSLFAGEAVKGRNGKANPRLSNNRKWLLGVQRSALGRAMNASAQKFAAMFRRAQRLEQARVGVGVHEQGDAKPGDGGNNNNSSTLQTELEETLNRSLGLSEGAVVNATENGTIDSTTDINAEGDVSFAIAPLGEGFHRITAAPNVVSLSNSYPDTLIKPSEYRSYFWKNFDEITRDWPVVIDTPEGPITWTKSKTEDKLKFFKDGEPAKLHFIAAANLPELLKNSTLAAVQKEGKADETVAEVHRRYAWAEFPDGTRRHILLTVDRMSELARPEQQLADRAYSSEVLGVSIEILPENKGADAVNLKEPLGTSPSGDQALTSAQRELNRFLAGIKPEHKPQSNTSFSVSPHYDSYKSVSKSTIETNPYRNKNGDLIIAENKALEARSELKALDAKFKRIVADSTQADALYNALPESKKGKVINTDIARKMLPEYAASPNGALNFVSATDAAAKSYVADRLWRELENPRGRRTFMMTGGGMGAGKSTVVNDAIVNLRDLVFDGTLRNADQAIKTIHQALKNGWNVEIRYVKRPFELAAQGVIDRAQAEGRWLHLADLEFAHYEAQKSIVKIAKHFANNPSVNISYWLNDGTTKMEPAKKLTLSQIDEGGEYSYTKSDEQRLDRTRNQRGRRGNAEGVSGETTAGGGETALHGIFRAAASSGLYSPEVIRNLAGNDQKLRAIVAERGTESSVDYKLSQYLLNHDNPNGKDKAIWFEQALGFNKNNAHLLAKQLVFNKDTAVQIGITQQGTKFNQMIDIKGVNGRTARIRVGWILNLDGVIRIVTAVPRP